MMEDSSSWTLTAGLLGALGACGLRVLPLRLTMRLARTGGSLEDSLGFRTEFCWAEVSMGSA